MKNVFLQKLPTGEFKNYPNRLYLGKLEVSATDVYAISNANHTNEFSESGKNQPSDKHDKINVSFESGKTNVQKNPIIPVLCSKVGKTNPIYI